MGERLCPPSCARPGPALREGGRAARLANRRRLPDGVRLGADAGRDGGTLGRGRIHPLLVVAHSKVGTPGRAPTVHARLAAAPIGPQTQRHVVASGDAHGPWTAAAGRACAAGVRVGREPPLLPRGGRGTAEGGGGQPDAARHRRAQTRPWFCADQQPLRHPAHGRDARHAGRWRRAGLHRRLGATTPPG